MSITPQPNLPVTLYLPASAMADASGNAVFSWPTPPSGVAYTGSLCCPSAPATAMFTAEVNIGQPITTWLSGSQAGPVQTLGAQSLTVVASGLTPLTLFQMMWSVTAEQSSIASPGVPQPLATTISITQISGGGAGITDLTSTGGTIIITDPTGPTTNIEVASGRGILAVATYAPSAGATYSINSATMQVIDDTNLAATFTAPASGNVVVDVQAGTIYSAGYGAFSIMDAAGLITYSDAPSTYLPASGGDGAPAFAKFYCTGLFPGFSYTFCLAAATYASTQTLGVTNNPALHSGSAFVMTVAEAP